jgi:hypothetical protein
MSADRQRAAIAALDRALDDRPDKIYEDLAAAVRCLVQLRADLTAGWRDGGHSDRLDRCNAILSMLIGSEYPLAGMRRERIQNARDELNSLFDPTNSR